MTANKKETELTQDDPKFLPTQYDMRTARITKIKKEYDPDLIPEANEKGDEGYLVIHNKVMDITKIRTAIEGKRKDLKADALVWGKLVDGEAKRLTEIVTELEKPWRDKKVALDEKEAKEAEEARQKEARRIEVIEGKVGQLKDGANGLLGLPVSDLKERLKLISEVVIDETYDDYMEAAQFHKDTAIGTIDAAIAEREIFEEQQAKAKLDQEAAAEKQRLIDAENAETKRKLDEQQDAIAAQQAENQRKLDEQQAAIDKQKADQKAKDDAELQRQVDVAEAERVRLEKVAEDEKKEKLRQEQEVELKKRLPEDAKLRTYLADLRSVSLPEVKNEDMQNVLVKVMMKLDEISDLIFDGTQDDIALFNAPDNKE